MVTALVVFGVGSTKADVLVLQTDVTSGYDYSDAVSGIAGSVGGNAAWDGVVSNYRLGRNGTMNLTDLMRFNDSATVGIGFIKNTDTTQTTINSAKFEIYSNQVQQGGSGTFYIAPITEDWSSFPVENNKTYAVPTYDTSMVSSFSADTTVIGWFEFDVKDIVQSWVDGNSNYGFAIYAVDEGVFANTILNTSRPYGLSPKLTIDYVITTIPEPTTWFLLTTGVGLLVALRYKRRAS